MATLSPMMQQYMQMKEQNKDCILLFRVGDFYEMFFEDAKLVSHELELTLTGKECGLDERAPMCGVPYHAVDTYVARLIEKGHKVAICDQMTDPALSKGLVERDVTRIITPGTLTDGGLLDERQNNFLLCVYFRGNTCGMAFCDVSTGEFFVQELKPYKESLLDEITRIQPNEIITNDISVLAPFVRQEISYSSYAQAAFAASRAAETLCNHFGVQDLSALGLEDDKMMVGAAGALMQYLNETQKNALNHISTITRHQRSGTMVLDRGTRRNLELTDSLRGHGKKGTLLWLLDHTSTAMGGRMLRSWIEEPLTDKAKIEKRLEAVSELCQWHILASTLQEDLNSVYDIERLLGKVAYKSLNARDCLALCQSFQRIPAIKNDLSELKSDAITNIEAMLDPVPEVTDLLERAISPDAPILLSDGGIIRDGYNQKLDEYREAARNGKQWVMDMEAREREETGIKNLKIQYNRVFGYYIEVTKSAYDLVPLRYQRKQTLTNAERYITPELREMEQKIVGAQEQGMRLELELFSALRDTIATHIQRMQGTAMGLKTLDALVSLAVVALENNYACPKMNTDGVLSITEGRHPVVEQTLRDEMFVPNDTQMDNEDQRMLIITGPNMAGKSTYMRQVALITLMAHIGSFVPAKAANIPIVDRIFTRVGASDDLASGQSTFMVEMSETANILRNATRDSLIILDEIGRGTSTFDGLAIAWAVVEYICDPQKIGAKTLFATHYHELSELEGHLAGVKNYCVSVKEHGEDIIFLRKIIKGGADKSFGVHVARLAGIPKPVVVRAHEIQATLEVSNITDAISQNILDQQKVETEKQVSIFSTEQAEIVDELQKVDVMAITPMDAMNILFRLREKARKL